METNYNEVDAAIFAHKHISPPMKKKYTKDQIEYLLDLVYEYYEAVEGEPETNVLKLMSHINANIKHDYCAQITREEIIQLLEADNLYMESIGLIEPEEKDEDLVYIDKIINDIYSLLSADLKEKYTKDDVYLIILLEWEYFERNEHIDETEMYKHIQQEAANERLNISIEEIEKILSIEADFLEED